MARKPRKEEPIEKSEIEDALIRLKIAVSALSDANELLDQGESIDAYYRPSFIRSLESISTFSHALRIAVEKRRAKLDYEDERQIESELKEAARIGAAKKAAKDSQAGKARRSRRTG